MANFTVSQLLASFTFYSVSASTMSWQVSHYLTMAMRELSNRRLVPLNTMRKTLTNSTPSPSPKWWRNPWAAWVHWGLACRWGWRGTPSCRPCWSRSPCWSWRGTHPGDLKNKPTVENLAFSDFLIGKKRKSVISYKKTWVDSISILNPPVLTSPTLVILAQKMRSELRISSHSFKSPSPFCICTRQAGWSLTGRLQARVSSRHFQICQDGGGGLRVCVSRHILNSQN